MVIDIEMVKGKAEVFLKLDKRVFIRTHQGDYYFSDILTVGEDYIYVQDFEGKRVGEKNKILWLDIIDIQEYRDVEANV